jgi:hypothetical protein
VSQCTINRAHVCTILFSAGAELRSQAAPVLARHSLLIAFMLPTFNLKSISLPSLTTVTCSPISAPPNNKNKLWVRHRCLPTLREAQQPGHVPRGVQPPAVVAACHSESQS